MAFAWAVMVFENIDYISYSVFIGSSLIVFIERSSRYVFVCFLMMFLGVIINMIIVQNQLHPTIISYYVNIMMFPSTFAVSIAMVRKGKKYVYIIAIIILMYLLYVVYLLNGVGWDGNKVFQIQTSRNYVSNLFLSASLLMSFMYYVKYEKISIVLPVVMFVLSIVFIGRTAIILSTLYVVISVLFVVNVQKINTFNKCIVFGLLFYGFFEMYYLIEPVLSQTKIVEGLETERWWIWSSYIENMDIKKIFIGVSAEDIASFNGRTQNPHNSYLELHSRIGIFIIAYFSLVMYSVKKYIESKEYYLMLLMFLFMIRIFDDQICFFYVDDYILYYFILYPIIGSPS